jgi:hypothetical protein
MTNRPTAPKLRALLVSLCAGVSIACASPPAIPLRGSPTAYAALVGEWDGWYRGRDAGRSGSIWFTLAAGEDHAHGDVLMTPRDLTVPYTPNRRGIESQPTRFLTIKFVRVSDGGLQGVLEPYWDPLCHCEAVTSFHGRLEGDRIRGTFVTRLEGAARSEGQWEATRRRMAAR